MQLSEKYINHKIFSRIDFFTENYEYLSTSASSYIQRGLSSVTSIDSIIYSSLKGTLESIKLLLNNGRINDAFALVRKYYEGIIIDIYKSVYIIEKHDIFKSLYVKQIEKWFKGEDKLPEYKNMIKFLNRVQILDGIRQFYDIQSDGYYNKIKEICNANLHYNKFAYMLVNNGDYYLGSRESYLSSILTCISSIFEFHIACIFILHTEYLTSSNYVDCLECGVEPIECSQNWISSFGEDLFNELWKNKQPVAQYIKSSTYLVFSDEIEKS